MGWLKYLYYDPPPNFSINSTFNIEDLVEYMRLKLISYDYFETPPNHTSNNFLETPTLIPFVIGITWIYLCYFGWTSFFLIKDGELNNF